MSKRLPKDPRSSEITPEKVYDSRREFIKNAALFTATAGGIAGGLSLLLGKGRVIEGPPTAVPQPAVATVPPSPPQIAPPVATADPKKEEPKPPVAETPPAPPEPPLKPGELRISKSQELAGGEAKTKYESVTTYNNYYEFGTDKSEPARNAFPLKPRPWAIMVEGEVNKPQVIDIDTLFKWFPLEERIYRMRCVEAWSMVIPWVGFPLADLVKRLEPTSKAKYIAFKTLLDPEQMPGQNRRVLEWPYCEGLRIDEATHPLALMAVGLYGKVLPNQNGAPLRLVVPWKYGFKGIKAIVKIRFQAEQPPTSWNMAAPEEYGFYANVNPDVDHPRWSQASERRIGDFTRRKTLPFNGYAEQVAGLYKNMDLSKFF